MLSILLSVFFFILGFLLGAWFVFSKSEKGPKFNATPPSSPTRSRHVTIQIDQQPVYEDLQQGKLVLIGGVLYPVV